MLKLKLGRLVGKKVLDHSLVSLEFWTGFQKKLNQIVTYDEKKRKEKERKRVKGT